MDKIPVVEQVDRWIDIFCYFDYPDELRYECYRIAHLNQDKKGYPHVMAAIAVQLACDSSKTKFDVDKAAKLVYSKRFRKTAKPGLFIPGIKKGALKWKL